MPEDAGGLCGMLGPVASQSDVEVRILDLVGRAVADGSPLPGEPALAVRLGVSRPALREALARLESLGILHRRRGSRPVINQAALALEGRFDQIADFADVLTDAGYSASVDVIDERVIALDEDAAAQFGLVAGASAWRITKRWCADRRPVRVAIDTIPLPADCDISAVMTRSVLEIVPELTGERVLWELALPGATNAPDDLATWFGVAPGTALLTLDCLGIAQSGERVFHALDHYLPWAVRLGLMRTVPAP